MQARVWGVILLLLLLAVGCSDPGETSPPPLDSAPELIEPAANRAGCAAIRGTSYVSSTERAWYLANCLQGGESQVALAERRCHPAYDGACLATDLGDYDCDGLGEDGPNFVRGRIRVVGKDEFLLDRDGDGMGCE